MSILGSQQTTMSNILQKFELDFNPFEPAATGAPLRGELSPPNDLAERARDFFDWRQAGQGTKAVCITGEYGSGKTCLLRWLHRNILPKRGIKSFYFDNPGVHFYDLANALLRTIGRKDFAKFIWEFAGTHVTYQKNLFQKGFEEYLSSASLPRPSSNQNIITADLQEAVKKAGVTDDDEIAHCLARIVTDTIKKPYFEYRDFVPRQSGSIVPEAEEAPYFRAVLQTISKGEGAQAVAFLIDEFEEIGLQKRLTKRAAHDYLATLRRLISLTQTKEINFWIVLSMTHDAYETTAELEPALVERFSEHVVRVKPLDTSGAKALMISRIDAARTRGTSIPKGNLFPFPENILFEPAIYSNPRRLIKTCHLALARADNQTQIPFSENYLRDIENKLYPMSTDKQTEARS